MMTDPRRCGFQPADLPRCAGDRPGAECVTATELAAIQSVYDGPTANGEPMFFGFSYGGERDPGGWDTWVVGSEALAQAGPPSLHFGFGTELYKNFVFSDPDWDYTEYGLFGRGRRTRRRRPRSSTPPIPIWGPSAMRAARSSTGPAGRISP